MKCVSELLSLTLKATFVKASLLRISRDFSCLGLSELAVAKEDKELLKAIHGDNVKDGQNKQQQF